MATTDRFTIESSITGVSLAAASMVSGACGTSSVSTVATRGRGVYAVDAGVNATGTGIDSWTAITTKSMLVPAFHDRRPLCSTA